MRRIWGRVWHPPLLVLRVQFIERLLFGSLFFPPLAWRLHLIVVRLGGCLMAAAVAACASLGVTVTQEITLLLLRRLGLLSALWTPLVAAVAASRPGTRSSSRRSSSRSASPATATIPAANGSPRNPNRAPLFLMPSTARGGWVELVRGRLADALLEDRALRTRARAHKQSISSAVKGSA